MSGLWNSFGQNPDSVKNHPDTSGWPELLNADLSNAVYPEGVWSFEKGILTASEDQNLWTEKEYNNFILDLEFKTAPETNSGVIVYNQDMENWIPGSIEIQIADDHSEKWGRADPKWQCGAIFGHLAPAKSVVEQRGEWNRHTITCIDTMIYVVLNGEPIIEMNLNRWTSAETNPDGSEIPAWLSTPLAGVPTKGRIGFQGKHGNAPIYFRNLRIRELN
jgi:hypothetical protein